MPTVRITTDWRHAGRMEWAGAPEIKKDGKIVRSIELPDEVFRGIEAAIAHGHIEGNVYMKDHTRFSWFLDR